ncbi:MAG: hypothetical protein JWM57_27 [Phycisphaerales bacterium]|nr:hypothetical protein [Phycisphaerales bacterium]
MTLTTRGSRLFPVDPFEVFGQDFSTAYGVDVREDADKVYVEAEMPGFKKDEVEIVLDKSVLTITAKKAETSNSQPQDGNGEGTQWLLRERSVREYRRAFRLPASADAATVEAKLEDGVLHLTLTKREETKPRRISVT